MELLNTIINSDCLQGLKTLPDKSVNCCVTSPPYYGLRDYGHEGQIGLEETPEQYVQKLVEVFREVKRVLKDDGTLWLNLGDSYAGGNAKCGTEGEKQRTNKGGSWIENDRLATIKNKLPGLKTKDLIGIPWMVAFALRADGWYLRQDIIWNKPNPMPESVTDRCTKSHEYIFLLSKSQKYYYDSDSISEKSITNINNKQGDRGIQGYAIASGGNNGNSQRSNSGGYGYKYLKENGQTNHTMHKNRALGNKDEDYPLRNKRSVWTVTTKPFSEAHFATFPEDLIVDCIKAGCPENGIVLDPFMGAGTTALVAKKLNRNYIGFELNREYIKIAERRIHTQIGLFINV